MYICRWVEEIKCLQLVAEEEREGAATVLTAYGFPLAPLSSFKYLGRILSASDDYWPVVVQNLRQVCKKWVRLMWMLGREGEDARILGVFYVEVVQAILLYGS